MKHAVAPRENRILAGLVAMAAAVSFFTAIDTSAKWLMLAGYPALQVVFARYAGHFALSLVVFVPREGRDAVISNAPWRQALRALFLLGSTVFNFWSLKYLPITVTTTIAFAMPVLVTLLAIPMLGERVGVHRIAAVCVGFVGVLIVMQPWGAGFHPAMLLNIAALCSASMYFVMTRLLAGIESNATSQIWASGMATVALVPFAVWAWVWPAGALDWAVLLGIGLLGGVGHTLATAAHRMADASVLAPVIYVQIFTATLSGVVVFGAWPTVWTLAGGAVIVAAGVYIWHRERRGAGSVTSTPL